MLRFRLPLVQWAPPLPLPLPRPHLPTPPLHLRPKPFHLSLRVSASDPRPSADRNPDGELEALIDLLPDRMRTRLASHPEMPHLIEVVMDLGRTPLARFPSGDFELARSPITFDDLHHGVSKVGEFGADNRAGISRTLHRISAIRNRNGVVVGLTCRVGRAITGSADSLRDLVQAGASLLLIGPPGVGKTTIIREISRTLSDDYQKRVMIVDTSNEIGGDGDIPHPGIGNARRMQVPNLDMQHKVLIEAVENHMPQAIIIDEIGTKLEAMAASTIAQRGIQLVATAHGVTFENLIMNPSLEMLVGGIQSVTLGDEEASRRGVQKTILERKGPSTFTCGVEIISKTELRVHHSLEATVDALLSGRSPKVKICKMHSDGFTSEMVTLPSENRTDVASYQQSKLKLEDIFQRDNEVIRSSSVYAETPTPYSNGNQICLRLYVYGIPETKVMQAIKQMRMNEIVYLSDNISESDAFLALHSKLKKNPQIHAAAKSTRLPIYVTKTSSSEEIAKGIRTLIKEENDGDEELKLDEIMPSEKLDALEEARLAIEQAVIPRGEPADLLPRPSHVLSAQFDLIAKYNLKAVRASNELGDFLRILPVHSTIEDGHSKRQDANFYGHHDDIDNCSDNSASGTVRLPFLPD